jgi:hypothetical protein
MVLSLRLSECPEMFRMAVINMLTILSATTVTLGSRYNAGPGFDYWQEQMILVYSTEPRPALRAHTASYPSDSKHVDYGYINEEVMSFFSVFRMCNRTLQTQIRHIANKANRTSGYLNVET